MASGQESKVRFVCVGLTDVGRVREHNEDNYLVANLAADKRGTSGEVLEGPVQQRGLALVVADGMGGAAAGEVASQMAVDMLHAEFKDADLGGTVRSEQNVIALLEGAINKANESIFRKGQESKEHQGMGTTLTAAVVLGDSLYLSQVGDSRGYVLRKGKLVQMTRDQSLIGQLIEEGTLTEEQAEKLGGKNIILQALGVEETLKVDSKRYDILRGDVLLLNSDGLSGMVPDAKMEEILAAEPDMSKAAKKLIEAANAGGGKDNITCILARFDGEGLREPLSPLTDEERAGGSFRAPPPPKSKAGRNAVIATAAVLALIGVVLFRPQPKKLFVNAGPVGGTVKVEGAAEGGPDGFEPKSMEFQPGQELQFTLPKDKEFEVTVEAPDHMPEKKHVSTKIETLEIHTVFELVRVPGNSLDLKPPVYNGKPLSRVKVKLFGRDKQMPPDKYLEAEVKDDAAAPEFPDKFPAGGWKYRAERNGFETAEKDFEVRSKEAVVVALDPMTESFGTLNATALPPHAMVTILDEGEPILEKPAEVLATRSTGPQKVRATRVVVKAACDGYKFQDKPAVVENGKEIEISFADNPASLSFKGAQGFVVLVPTEARPGAKQSTFSVGENGQSEKKSIAPGTYKATYTDPNGVPSMSFEMKIQPGQVLQDLDPITGR